MLSILIPTYNYNTYPLVRELKKQCEAIHGLIYQIIVNDDASSNDYDNLLINELQYCVYYKQNSNQGLSASRNFLAKTANYEWCILLDDDVWPENSSFIKNYLKHISENSTPALFFGGLKYSDKKPQDKELLRWIYGKKHEALSYEDRVLKKPNHFLCSNNLVHKSILKKFIFPEEIKTYGYEDLIFNLELIKNKIPIFQVNNTVLHEKLDTSEFFLFKTKKALDNLKISIDSNLINSDATLISKTFNRFNKRWIIYLISFLFSINRKWMENILTEKNTNLKLYNMYRLGYFFSIHK